MPQDRPVRESDYWNKFEARRYRPNLDRWTDRAMQVLALADLERERLGHTYIGTEHILLGIVREGNGIAAGVLEQMGVHLDKIRESVEGVIGRGQTT